MLLPVQHSESWQQYSGESFSSKCQSLEAEHAKIFSESFNEKEITPGTASKSNRQAKNVGDPRRFLETLAGRAHVRGGPDPWSRDQQNYRLSRHCPCNERFLWRGVLLDLQVSRKIRFREVNLDGRGPRWQTSAYQQQSTLPVFGERSFSTNEATLPGTDP